MGFWADNIIYWATHSSWYIVLFTLITVLMIALYLIWKAPFAPHARTKYLHPKANKSKL